MNAHELFAKAVRAAASANNPGERIAVQTVLEFLGAGESETEILNQYPNLEAEDIKVCLRFGMNLQKAVNRRCTPINADKTSGF